MPVKAAVMFGLTAVVVVVLLGSVLLPTAYTPTQRASATSINSTAFAPVTNTTANRTFAVVTPYSGSPETMTVTFATNSTFAGLQLMTKAGVLIGTFVNTTTTSAAVSIPVVSIDAGTAQTYGFKNNLNNTEAINVSSMSLAYIQQSNTDTWSVEAVALWIIVPIVIVAAGIYTVS